MAELYGVDVPTINYHIQQVYKDNELTAEATIRNFLIVQTESNRQVTREELYCPTRERHSRLQYYKQDKTNPCP